MKHFISKTITEIFQKNTLWVVKERKKEIN